MFYNCLNTKEFEKIIKIRASRAYIPRTQKNNLKQLNFTSKNKGKN